MKCCMDDKRNLCLLAGLFALLLTSYASAADKKLSPVQQLRSTNPGHTVHAPVKVKPSFVPLNAVKQTGNKPLKKSVGIKPAGIKPVPSPVVKIKPQAYRGLSPIVKSPRQPVKPVVVVPRAVQPRSGFNHKVRPVAPGASSPRNRGITPSLPAVRRAAPPLVKQNRGGAGSLTTPKHGFSLKPPKLPAAGASTSSPRGGFAPAAGNGRQTNLPVKQLNSVTGGLKPPAHRGGFVPKPVYDGAATPGRRAPGRASTTRKKPATKASQNPLPGGNTSISRPDLTVPFSVRNQRSKDDERSGEYANDILNNWVEDDMAIGGGKVPDPDYAPIVKPPPKEAPSATRGGFDNGDVTSMQSDGSKVTRHLDGSADTFDTEGGHLETSSGIKTTPGAHGGTDVEDRSTGVRGHFGAENVHNETGGMKDGGELPDGRRVTNESDGSISIRNVDGSTETWQRDGTYLQTGPGIKTTPGAHGGTDVEDRGTGVRGHFGAENVHNETGGMKDGGELPDGRRVTNESDGSISIRNVDGSTETWQRDGTYLQTGPGIKTTPGAHGGTDVEDRSTGVRGHFGVENVRNDTGDPKYIGGGTVQNPDGSKEKGEKPESNFSSDSDDSTDSSGSNNSSDDNNSDDDADNNSDDNDDNNDDDNADDNANDDNSDEGSGDDDSGDEDSSDESSIGFESGRGGDGGPEPDAKTIVDDRVAHMKGEKRDVESADDSEPGNGGSAPDSVSQPGPGAGHRGSPLARPSTEGHQPPVNVVVPAVKSPSSVGGGDCFQREGCDNAPTGDFRLDPLNRDPVTNPGGH